MQQIDFALDNPLSCFLLHSKFRIYRHLLLVILVIIVAFNGTTTTFVGYTNISNVIIVSEGLVLTLIYLGTIYVNNFFLIPRLLLKDKYLLYISSIAIILLGLNILIILADYYLINSHHIDSPGKYSFFYKDRIVLLEMTGNFLFMSICFVGSSVTVLMRHLIHTGKRMNELEQSSIHSELDSLKSQINPQLLSDTLNNAGNLAPKSPERASEILLKLSKLLRYQLYDSTHNKVLLDADIAFLENFLNLEKIQHANFSYNISKKGIVNALVPPLLFIPIVEYVMNQIPKNESQSFIQLLFEMKDKMLHFTCIYHGPNLFTEDNNDDYSLVSVRRRLNLLYNKSYSLKITAEKAMIIANMQLTS